MNIGIIAASGKAGRLITLEALRRGHRVTAIVRDQSKMKGLECEVLEKDLYSLTADDLKAFDAVVDAYGTGAADATGHQTSMEHLIRVMEKLPDVRFLVVGGAASLYTDAEKKQLVMETIPEQFRAVPASMAKAFENLKASNVNWTFFSPACMFDPYGEKTGKYVTGGDVAVQNSENKCYISYADYAIAMVDEIENKQHVKQRFTAAAEKTTTYLNYYGLEKKEPQFEGISQYRAPLNYELAGKRFKLIMDNGDDAEVCFTSGKTLEWQQGCAPVSTETYECGKSEELAYFVNFELHGITPRINISLVLDLQTRLVTICRAYTGHNARQPYLVDLDFYFGAIEMPGFALPKKRHGYTTDLIGKRIVWHYNPGFSVVHVYYHPNYIRGTFLPEDASRRPAIPPEMRAGWDENPYDEKGAFIKVREGLYIVSIYEQSKARRQLASSNLLFLMNTNRVHDVGRSFGHSPHLVDGKIPPENYLFTAFGEFVYSDGEVEAPPPFYVVGGGQKWKKS